MKAMVVLNKISTAMQEGEYDSNMPQEKVNMQKAINSGNCVHSINAEILRGNQKEKFEQIVIIDSKLPAIQSFDDSLLQGSTSKWKLC